MYQANGTSINWSINLLYKLECLKEISTFVKNYDNCSRVFSIANKLLARHSLYLAP